MFRTLWSSILAFLLLVNTVPAIEKVCGPFMKDAYAKNVHSGFNAQSEQASTQIVWRKHKVYYTKIVLR